METYPKIVRLEDASEALLRPMQPNDLDRLHDFFLSLPEEDRLYLLIDVTDRDQVAIRMESTDATEHWRLVALQGDRIVGDAGLSQPRYGWKRHSAEIRIIVARELQDRGLGTLLLRELFQEATHRGVEKLFAMVAPEQHGAIRMIEKVGFRSELRLKDHRRTLHGELGDVLCMTVSIADAWQRMEDLAQAMDGDGRERH